MAAPVLLKLKSATFKGKAIVGTETATIDISGSEQTAGGDGAITAQVAYSENITAKVSVQALQASTTDKDLMNPGNGALVLVGFVQAAGVGQTAGQDKTFTFPNASLTNSSRSMPRNGNPTINLNFTCVDADGNLATLYSIA